MRNKKLLLVLSLTLLCLLCVAVDAYAGPGGKIAKVMFSTFWGKIMLVCLIVLFLPIIIFNQFREFFKVRKTMKALNNLAVLDRNFDWQTIKKRITDVVTRVHVAWGKEDLSTVTDYVTAWYWQNQQLVYLDKWKDQGKINRSDLRHINKLTPLHLVHSGEPGGEGSILIIGVDVNAEDYLIERDTGLLLEGEKGYRDMTTVWSFNLHNGQWILDNIEQINLWQHYLGLTNTVPASALQQIAVK